ncbi:MAG: hypothetical protein RXN90_09695 [Thermoproteus sp.]
MAQNRNQASAPTAAGAAGASPAPKVRRDEIDNVRSYMFEGVELREVLHIDWLDADDIARAIEKLAEMSIEMGVGIWTWIGEDRVTLKLSDVWRVKIMRDGAVIIKVPDYALIADSGGFLLLHVDEGGWYIPTVKGKEITWDGTEEYFDPTDIYRLARDVARRILEQTRWL